MWEEYRARPVTCLTLQSHCPLLQSKAPPGLAELAFEDVTDLIFGCPCPSQPGPDWTPSRRGSRPGGLHLEEEAREEVNLILNVTVIYRLCFLGKVQRFISERQAVCKHTAYRCSSVGC